MLYHARLITWIAIVAVVFDGSDAAQRTVQIAQDKAVPL
jgi:hypothetical protein